MSGEKSKPHFEELHPDTSVSVALTKSADNCIVIKDKETGKIYRICPNKIVPEIDALLKVVKQ